MSIWPLHLILEANGKSLEMKLRTIPLYLFLKFSLLVGNMTWTRNRYVATVSTFHRAMGSWHRLLFLSLFASDGSGLTRAVACFVGVHCCNHEVAILSYVTNPKKRRRKKCLVFFVLFGIKSFCLVGINNYAGGDYIAYLKFYVKVSIFWCLTDKDSFSPYRSLYWGTISLQKYQMLAFSKAFWYSMYLLMRYLHWMVCPRSQAPSRNFMFLRMKWARRRSLITYMNCKFLNLVRIDYG